MEEYVETCSNCGRSFLPSTSKSKEPDRFCGQWCELKHEEWIKSIDWDDRDFGIDDD